MSVCRQATPVARRRPTATLTPLCVRTLDPESLSPCTLAQGKSCDAIRCLPASCVRTRSCDVTRRCLALVSFSRDVLLCSDVARLKADRVARRLRQHRSRPTSCLLTSLLTYLIAVVSVLVQPELVATETESADVLRLIRFIFKRSASHNHVIAGSCFPSFNL